MREAASKSSAASEKRKLVNLAESSTAHIPVLNPPENGVAGQWCGATQNIYRTVMFMCLNVKNGYDLQMRCVADGFPSRAMLSDELYRIGKDAI
ncbi:hypothetical protein ACWGTI_16760 [Mesorhizobium sp. ArgA1]